MKIENKDFWERDDVIHSQDKHMTSTSDYEMYLYKKAQQYFSKMKITVNKAKSFGCGTGRELNGIIAIISPEKIVATDIAENMIRKAKVNVQEWGFQDRVTLEIADATQYSDTKESYDLVTLMSCTLTYISKKADRYAVFKTSYDILKPKGCLVGVVHNQVGTPQKTVYFLLRRMLKPFLKNEVGNRTAGFYGFDVPGYYFSKKDLLEHLQDNGFKNIEIKSLSELYKETNKPYNRLKGYNNLVFFATK
jgi:ubiquinone/menaquinone biosynthesis C-methylase UbiE